MKVKITHTIGFEDVPAKIDELIHLIRTRLVEISKTPMNTASLSSFAESVNNIRVGLGIVDAQLEDTLGMLQGYYEVIQQMSMPDLPPDLEQAVEDTEDQEDEV